MTNAKGLPQGRIRQVAALVAPAEGMLFWQAVLLLSALQPSCCRSTSELYRKEVRGKPNRFLRQPRFSSSFIGESFTHHYVSIRQG